MILFDYAKIMLCNALCLCCEGYIIFTVLGLICCLVYWHFGSIDLHVCCLMLIFALCFQIYCILLLIINLCSQCSYFMYQPYLVSCWLYLIKSPLILLYFWHFMLYWFSSVCVLFVAGCDMRIWCLYAYVHSAHFSFSLYMPSQHVYMSILTSGLWGIVLLRLVLSLHVL